MGSTRAFVGDGLETADEIDSLKNEIYQSILRLQAWLERTGYRGYDTFDGLNAPYLRPLTFETKLLRTVLLQGVRRFPLNLRPVLGIKMGHSSKGMGFLARGFIRLHETTAEEHWAEKARFALEWLVEHPAKGFSGWSWGNHFDYQSRGFYLPRGTPTVVWTSLIGHAFLDGYDHFREPKYLEIAVGACEHILRDLKAYPDGAGICINYIPGSECRVHNANTLGGSLLARVYWHTRNERFRSLAQAAMQYAAQYQLPNGAWWYGERADMHWVDNFHTAYVLDCLKYYSDYAGDDCFERNLQRGYDFWKNTFFLADGTPKYYDGKTLPIDIQCSSQAIDTLVFHSDRDPEAIPLAVKVAKWTIQNMQDPTGYFYYRRYNPWLVNRTPTLHWGQATMLCALAGLYRRVCCEARFV
jgi:polysaccharide biosynthesis protein VpsJ